MKAYNLNVKKISPVFIIMVTLLLAVSLIAIMSGVFDLYHSSNVALSVELSKLHIDLGYNTIDDWIRDYKWKSYSKLIGGLTCLVIAVWLIFRKGKEERGQTKPTLI